ncbi:MAG TPA: glycosyltransferase [Actinospica sp.]|nr:glycosyltransferase [Actinospica sp.]
MRIAIVGPGYPPAPGGVEAVVAHSARALARAGHEVEVLAQERNGDLPDVETESGVVVRRFRSNRAENLRLAPGLYSHLAKHAAEYDVVHGHSYHALVGVGAALVTARRASGVPYVLSPHFHGTGHTEARALLHRLYTPVGRAAVAASRSIVCVSPSEADLFRSRFPKAVSKISVIPNAVDTDTLRAAAPLVGEAPTVLSVGRLETYKRVDRLIAAFGVLARDGAAPPRLVVIGTGPDRARLEALAADACPAGAVRFLGRVEDAELHRWLRTASVLCSLSEHEAYGLAPAEALAAGARVVLSDIPAHRQFTASGYATLVPADADAPALADELAGALAADRQPADAPSPVPNWDEVAASLADLYRSLAAAERVDEPAGALA